jgi:antitoxin HicB
MSIQYKAIITEEQKGEFFVQFPALNEAFTEGRTWKEALLNAAEVLNLSLEGRLIDGLEIPSPDVEKCADNEYLMTPDANIQSALLIYFNRRHLSPTELTNIGQKIEYPKNNITLSELEKIAFTMGKKLIVDFA